MANFVLTDAKVWWDGYDLSGDHNSLTLDYGAEELDETAYGDDTRVHKGGLKFVSLDGEGWWDAGADLVDPTLFGKVGSPGTALCLAAEGGDEGEIAYMFKPMESAYNIGAAVGEILPFTTRARAQSSLVRGTIIQNGSESSSDAATARQLGALSASQKLYAALHVFSASGTNPTLDVLVRSDDNAGMTSPTTRITFNQATDRSSQWATPISGAITDDYFDVSWTIGGTDSPAFNFVVVVGIL